MDRIVDIEIRGERVIGGGVVVGAAGSHDDVKLQMTFDNKWDGLSKKVIFQNANGENSVFVLLGSADTGTTNVWTIYVPAEPKEFEGKMRFGVKGFSVEYRLLTAEPDGFTTNYSHYYTENSGVYTPLSEAVTFAENTYYECVETKAVMAARTEFSILPSLSDEDAESAQSPTPDIAEQLQPAIDDLDSRTDDAEEDIETLQGQMETAQDDISGLDGRLDTAEDNITTAQGDISDLQSGKQDKLTFDNSPTQNSTNPVTSGGLWEKFGDVQGEIDAIENDYATKSYVSDIKDRLDEDIDNIGDVIPSDASSSNQLADKSFVNSSIATAVSAVYRYKASKTVSEINALTGMVTGDVYNVLDSGTLTIGSVVVKAGDNVVWNGSAWDKLAADVDLSNYYNKTETDTKLGLKEAVANKVTALSGSSTDTEYPSAKCVYDELAGKVAKDGNKVLSDNNYTDTDAGTVNDMQSAFTLTKSGGRITNINVSGNIGFYGKSVGAEYVTAEKLNIMYAEGETQATPADIKFPHYVSPGSDKTMQDYLDAKQDNLVFKTTYNASTNKAATMADITDAKPKWKFLGETEIESGANASDAMYIDISETGFFANTKYKEFRLVLDIKPIDAYTYLFFIPFTIQFNVGSSRAYKLFLSQGNATGSIFRITASDNFKGELRIIRDRMVYDNNEITIDKDWVLTEFLNPVAEGADFNKGKTIYCGGNPGHYENGASASTLNRIYIQNYYAISGDYKIFAPGSKMQFFGLEV